MDALPRLVLHKISADLSTPVLASWCAVSRNTRYQLNFDEFWEHRCDQQLAEYLRQTDCQVQPFFINPEDTGWSVNGRGRDGLSDICESRLSVMRETHLWNNWKQNMHTSLFVPDENVSTFSHSMNEIKDPILIYRNDFLVVLDNSCSQLQLWNINNPPVRLFYKSLNYQTAKVLGLSNDFVVVKQGTLLNIFRISLPNSDFLLEQSLVFEQFALFALSTSFIVLVNRCPYKLQVWNINTGEKMREEDREDQLCFKIVLSDTYLTVQAARPEQASPFYCLLVYRTCDFCLVFTSDMYDGVKQSLVIGDRVFILVSDFTDLYCLKTNQLLKRINIIPLTNLDKFDSRAWFLDTKGNMVILTPGTLEVEIIPFKQGCVTGVTFLNILSTKYFLTVEKDEESCGIWLGQIKDKELSLVKKLGRFTDLRTFKVNETRTKLFLSFYVDIVDSSSFKERINILTFW